VPFYIKTAAYDGGGMVRDNAPASMSVPIRDGKANTGGGGAAGYHPSPSARGGNGGSGIVIVRWWE
jgi:hypothetical protein